MRIHRVVAKIVVLSTITFLVGCASHGPGPRAPHQDEASVALLQSWLTGSFSSEAQAAADKDYRDIRLHMTPIWLDRSDGPWMYVEQAMAADQAQPYRQRVYRLGALGGDKVQSEVFELASSPDDALKFAGAWKDPSLLADLAPEGLARKDGCEVVLKWFPAERAFKGGTLGANCVSTFRGAAHASSEIVLSDGSLVSWDRGFDRSGTQVWGAEKGGYRFVRLAE